MGDSKEEIEDKKKIKKELKDKELGDIILGLIYFIVASGIFGYIGYIFCKGNQLDAQRGMVFWALYPIGLALLNAMNVEGKFCYIVYTIGYIIIVQYIPVFAGIIILFLIILIFLTSFIVILKRDRTAEVDKIYKERQDKSIIYTTYTAKSYYMPQTVWKEERTFEETEKYECERCFKEITEEEYDLYDGMCEECFDESHFDFDGKLKEDYWNY